MSVISSLGIGPLGPVVAFLMRQLTIRRQRSSNARAWRVFRHANNRARTACVLLISRARVFVVARSASDQAIEDLTLRRWRLDADHQDRIRRGLFGRSDRKSV